MAEGKNRKKPVEERVAMVRRTYKIVVGEWEGGWN